ncbi:MAG: 5'/3'-nucleotidase SurE [Bacteroidales bacterium]|jgi:5'-nucleotidase|nr:5'/3'-nucleotidase SurE [Bacteroidales bacterium]
MTNSQKLILITNDDGFFSRGIAKLAEVMSRLGRVIVVAPQSEMSGQSHSITVTRPISFKAEKDMPFECFSVDGTPVDCVKLALNKILPSKPDLVVAGINHGCNASINTIYSGTMAAVFEGCAEGISSIGFSMFSHSKDVCLDFVDDYIYDIAQNVLTKGLDKGVCLNVNFPIAEIKGVKVCHQADAYWNEEFVSKQDGDEGEVFWLNGVYNLRDTSDRADYRAIRDDYVAITPMQVDFTAYKVLESYAERFDKI